MYRGNECEIGNETAKHVTSTREPAFNRKEVLTGCSIRKPNVFVTGPRGGFKGKSCHQRGVQKGKPVTKSIRVYKSQSCRSEKIL